MNLHKTSVLLLSLFIFSSCSIFPKDENTEDENQAVPEGFNSYESELLNTIYPENWEVITSFDEEEYPIETFLAFKNPEKTENFYANVNVSKIKIDEKINSLTYADKKIENHKIVLADYTPLDQKEIEVFISNEKEMSKIVLFTAKYDSRGKDYKFIQTFLVKYPYAYTVTGTMGRNEQETIVKAIQTVLKSLALK